MTPDDILGLFGDALTLVIIMVGIIVLPSLFVGLVVSVFQAATQINEQTLSFLPRLLATLIALMVAGPWMLGELMDFSSNLLLNIPTSIG